MSLTRNQENEIITVLGAPIARQLIDLIHASDQERNTGPANPPLVKNTQPIHDADTDYTKTVNGVVVTYLTTIAV